MAPTPPPTNKTSSHLRFSASAANVTSTSLNNHDRNDVSSFVISEEDTVANISDYTSTTISTVDDKGLPEGMIALAVGLVALGGAIVSLLLYLKITEKLYKFLPIKLSPKKRRGSTASSQRPLDVDDTEETLDDQHTGAEEDGMPKTREATLFTIDDFEPVINDEYSRTAQQEEYFYDEVFGQSVFEDEATNASMRHLYLASDQDDDEMFDVDAIVNSVTGPKRPPATATSNTATTTTTATTTARGGKHTS